MNIPEFYSGWRKKVESELTILPFSSHPVYISEPLQPKQGQRNYIYLLMALAFTLTVSGFFFK